jgi:hypothetical protein
MLSIQCYQLTAPIKSGGTSSQALLMRRDILTKLFVLTDKILCEKLFVLQRHFVEEI